MEHKVVEFEQADAETVVHLYGLLDRDSVDSAYRDTMKLIEGRTPGKLTMDFSQVQEVDSCGVAFLRSIHDACQKRGIAYSELGINGKVEEFLHYVRERSRDRLEKTSPPPRPDFISRAGLHTQRVLDSVQEAVAFFGNFLKAGAGRILHPRTLHLQEILYHMELAGVGAVPIICGLSFLLGMLMVFQGSSPLQGFGSGKYLADLVVISVTREMAPLVVGIIVAGRSGAAFAAEIGTMKLNEELDALTVMDLDVLHFIILPRVIALALVQPVLTMIADFVGILGGLLTSHFVADIPVATFINAMKNSLSAADIYTGLIKSMPFGMLIGITGCYKGLKTGMGAGSVGIQATSAAVSSIFMVIMLDTTFSYIFSRVHL